MACKSKVLVDRDSLGKMISLKLFCDGTCSDGSKCAPATKQYTPDRPRERYDRCECPGEQPIGCYVVVKRRAKRNLNPFGAPKPFKPYDFDCMGSCDDETMECTGVRIDVQTLKGFANHSYTRETWECQCIPKLESVPGEDD